ncbi:MAG: hypothetical protein A4E49_00128 [Methanosaeta sp. PtaU1.Bin112]|nr:MAG: hypothetical protein A4E49_00128 [Methanosaeta sp. PtaU1.Bin112]
MHLRSETGHQLEAHVLQVLSSPVAHHGIGLHQHFVLAEVQVVYGLPGSRVVHEVAQIESLRSSGRYVQGIDGV